mmetsp:Transcript_39051/g.116576  ORF Transcript_39051/g.116576 Transcript_39051/m.116576 type:complete len:251 (+) Transcript_39051:455-1207(+)
MLSEGQVRSREQQPHLRVLAHPAASHLERAALRLAECALLQRLPADGEAGLQPLDAPQLRAERLRVLAAPQRPLLQHIRRAVELAEPRESRRLPAAQLAQLRARLVPQPLRAVGHSPLVLSEHHPARRAVAVQRAVPRLRTDRLRVEPQRLGVLASLVQRVALLSQRRGCARARTGALAAAAHTATAAAAAAHTAFSGGVTSPSADDRVWDAGCAPRHGGVCRPVRGGRAATFFRHAGPPAEPAGVWRGR